MDRRDLVAVGAACIGCTLIVVGVFQEFVHLAPGYEGMIVTEWGGGLLREERRLAQVSILGIVGTVAAVRWTYATAVPVAVGGVVLVVTLQAIRQYANYPGLYREVPKIGGGTNRYILGVEPVFLIAGALFLIGAGLACWRMHHDDPPAGTTLTANS